MKEIVLVVRCSKYALVYKIMTSSSGGKCAEFEVWSHRRPDKEIKTHVSKCCFKN